ncbi:MAG: hypothetical protein JNL05_13025 [Flavobacteriales bacterium]|nr:hypothetical protein [Flavobacteriales bacterium]
MAGTQPTTIDLRKLSAPVRNTVLAEYWNALKAEDAVLTLQEAAWLYGYRYGTLRWYASQGYGRKRLRCRRRKGVVTTTHAAMRAHIAAKRATGSPRKALKEAQTSLA